MLSFNASSVPVLQLALSSKTLSQSELFDYGQNFIRPQLATVAGAAIPVAIRRQGPAGPDRYRSAKTAHLRALREDVVAAIADQNLITPVGTQKIGEYEYIVSLNVSPTSDRRTERSSDQKGRRNDQSISVMWPSFTTAARRKSMWCGSTAAPPC